MQTEFVIAMNMLVKMSHFEAMRLLDKVKDGVPYPLHLINKALELTGDLEQT